MRVAGRNTHSLRPGLRLQQALKLVQFNRQCDEVMYWIRDKVGEGDSCIHQFYPDFRRRVYKQRFDKYICVI